jgi:preprotein translocase subunit YajC
MELMKYGTQAFMLFGVALAFYVALIKPQLDRISSNQTFLDGLKAGDTVVTAGGLVGRIVRFDGTDVVILALNDAIHIRVVRSGIDSYFQGEHAPLDANEKSATKVRSPSNTA